MSIRTPVHEEIIREVGSFKLYGQKALGQSIYDGAGTGNLMEIMYLGLGMAGETGEAIDAIKKMARMGLPKTLEDQQRWNNYREKLKEELGDAFWYIAQIMRVYDLTLPEVIGYNLLKLDGRVENNEVAHHS